MMKRSNLKRDLEYFKTLEYPVQLSKQDEDGDKYWLAEILDLPGCMSHGETPDEAVANVHVAKELWIETALSEGQTVPEPSNVRGYSGRLVLRIPRSLHRKLAGQAKRDGVSLNQYLLTLLAEGSEKQSPVHGILELLQSMRKDIDVIKKMSTLAPKNERDFEASTADLPARQ